MIEFRAACGHSIRAREEDAGKTVKCNYCGASVQVPDPSASALDYLFASEAEEASGRSTRPGRASGRRPGGDIPIIGGLLKETNPVRLVMTFVYIGIVLVVAVVGGKYAWLYVKAEFIDKGSKPMAVAPAPSRGPGGGGSGQGEPTGKSAAKPKPGSKLPFPMLFDAGENGLYVTSVPLGATVFVRTKDQDEESNDALGEDASESVGKTPLVLDDEAGEYAVAVAVPRTHPDLTPLPEYGALLKKIRSDPTSDAAAQYFIPDGSTDLRVDRPAGAPEVFVRKYNVAVRKGKWTPVIALFLPDKIALFLPGKPADALLEYLPTEKQYNVDTQRVMDELSLQGVAAEVQSGIIDVLEKVGKAVYRSNDNECLVFQLLPDPDELLYAAVVK